MTATNLIRVGLMVASSVTLVGAAGALAACSSSPSDPFGPSPDFNQLQAKFDHPSGTFARGSEASVFGSYASQRGGSADQYGIATTGSGGATGSGGTGITTQSLRILDNAGGTSSATWCSALAHGASSGSCACPSGGTVYYDMSGVQQVRAQNGAGPVDVTLRLRYDACAIETTTIDGREFAKMKSVGTPSASDLEMLLDAHFRVSAPGLSETVDLDLSYVDGKWWISVTVDDGFIVVGSDSGYSGATKTGTIYVHERGASWTCTLTNGQGTCTSDQGETRQVQ